jgi:hypothetical protein
MWGAYKAFVLGQQDGNACIDLADSERDEHFACGWLREVCCGDVLLGKLTIVHAHCGGGPKIRRASIE